MLLEYFQQRTKGTGTRVEFPWEEYSVYYRIGQMGNKIRNVVKSETVKRSIDNRSRTEQKAKKLQYCNSHYVNVYRGRERKKKQTGYI